MQCHIDVLNSNGATPLLVACSQNLFSDNVNLLIEDGRSDLNIQDRNGNTSLHGAINSEFGSIEKIKHLLGCDKCDPNIRNRDGDTPLHIAMMKDIGIFLMLSNDKRCDPNIQDSNEDTALHIAICSKSNCVLKVQYLLKCSNIDPNIANSKGYTPLHEATERNESMAAAQILKHSLCNPNIQDVLDENTPLHIICVKNISVLDVMPYLEHEAIDLTIRNKKGNTTLHEVALCVSAFEVFNVILSHKSSNPEIKNHAGKTALNLLYENNGETLLHYACRSRNAQITLMWMEYHSVLNSEGDAPIHVACRYTATECLRELLQNSKCDPNQKNAGGECALHILCRKRNVAARKCLQLVLNCKRIQINLKNNLGDTALHVLCRLNTLGLEFNTDMVRTLLTIPGIDIECVNNAGEIPLELAKNSYQIIKIVTEFTKHKSIETYLKLFVVGNSGTGKSTLIKAIIMEASQRWLSFKGKQVNPKDVPPHTAGIVPIPFTSKHFGHAVLYDFAGQHEYYSSHAAVMENLILPTPPLFLLLIDISKPIDILKHELLYWWMYIDNQIQPAKSPPYVFLVGSYKDVVREKGEDPHKRIEQILDSVRDIPVSFKFITSFPLDCRQLVSRGLAALLTELNTTCKALRQTADIDLHCHILKSFLATEFIDLIACKMSDIAEKIQHRDVLLPQQPDQLIPLLAALNDQGYILLLQNHTDVNTTWVILKPEVLLTEVNGSIFAPKQFTNENKQFANSTGVVTLLKIKERLHILNHEVITGYLTHMEYCFQITDQRILEMITKDSNLRIQSRNEQNTESYYFFPGLVLTKKPSYVCQEKQAINFQYGWLYRCAKETEQLTTRFLHVLILRLAFSCEPPDNPTEMESVVLLRSCSVWKHGIAWWTNDGIETIVEVDVQCRWVAVMMRCPTTHNVQCAELRSKVVSTVFKVKDKCCPSIKMKEFLIASSTLKYPFDDKMFILYTIREIANVVIRGKGFAKDSEGKGTLEISDLLPFEPYFNMRDILNGFFSACGSDITIEDADLDRIAEKCYCNLEGFVAALEPNPTEYSKKCREVGEGQLERCVALFQILQKRGCKTWRDFEREFSRFSIFCGRNPLVSLIK